MSNLPRNVLWEVRSRAEIVAGLILFLGCGCGPSPADTEFMKMVSKTREGYSASKIRAAALPLIVNSQTNAPSHHSTSSRIPREIAELPMFAAEGSEIAVWAVGNTGDKPRGLAFVTGSGFGHWGIVVCAFENGEQAAKSLHGKVILWGDGVFFYKDW
jgi:hypothetical protein